VVIDVLANDMDIEGDTPTIIGVTQDATGTITLTDGSEIAFQGVEEIQR
jgi:hypothetical protein